MFLLNATLILAIFSKDISFTYEWEMPYKIYNTFEKLK